MAGVLEGKFNVRPGRGICACAGNELQARLELVPFTRDFFNYPTTWERCQQHRLGLLETDEFGKR